VKKRPILVTVIAVYVFLLSAINAVSVYTGLSRQPLLSQLDTSVPLWLIVIIRGMWSVIWLACAIGLWNLWAKSRQFTIVLFPIYQFMNLTHQMIFVQGDYERGRLPFTAGLTIISVALLGFALTRPRVRDSFNTNDSHISNLSQKPPAEE